MRDTEREAETQAEGEAGSLWGAQCRTPSQDQILHQVPCMEPASTSACVSTSLCVSLMNKYIKSLKKNNGSSLCFLDFDACFSSPD